MKFYLVVKNEDLREQVLSILSKIGMVLSSVEDADLIVSIGGDGTLLGVALLAIKYNKPLVGINAGHLGYLCAFKIEELSSLSIDDFKSLKETNRTLIEYNGHIAINDVCVLKGNPVQSIEVNVRNVGFWKGDGVIVSTATGSSSYNKSAGGPLLEQESSYLIVTPICPINPKQGYKIIKEDKVVIDISHRTATVISVDNNLIEEVPDTIEVRRSDKKLRLLSK